MNAFAPLVFYSPAVYFPWKSMCFGFLLCSQGSGSMCFDFYLHLGSLSNAHVILLPEFNFVMYPTYFLACFTTQLHAL